MRLLWTVTIILIGVIVYRFDERMMDIEEAMATESAYNREDRKTIMVMLGRDNIRILNLGMKLWGKDPEKLNRKLNRGL